MREKGQGRKVGSGNRVIVMGRPGAGYCTRLRDLEREWAWVWKTTKDRGEEGVG